MTSQSNPPDPRSDTPLHTATGSGAPAPAISPLPEAGALGSLEALCQRLSHPAPERARHLGEALLQRGLIDTSTLTAALQQQARLRPHRLLGQLIVERGALSAGQLDRVLAEWLGVPTVDLALVKPQADALKLLPAGLALRETALPLALHQEALVVAVTDPWDQALLEQLRFVCERPVLPVLALPGTLAPAVARAYAAQLGQPGAAAGGPAGAGDTSSSDPANLPPSAAPRDVHALVAELARHDADHGQPDTSVVSEADNTLVRLVHTVIADAIRLRASDIHIETSDNGRPTRIRLRVDGDLQPYVELPAQWRFAVVARLKIMAELDISEHRRPQDGKIDFARFGGDAVELRMVTVPTHRGLEDVVLRLLSGLKPLPLDEIGLSARNLTLLRQLATKPYGLILVCGPTGCGKTTTLHSLMRELNTDQRKIWTAEDPVEITQEGLRQVQVNPRLGWDFAAAMRTFLRADPDVVMIGEMRDRETAGIAVEASLTGHLVLSTLHTNSAPESVTRLLEIGIDPFLFSDSLLGILAQRLVRRLCTHCREPQPLTPPQEQDLARQYLESGGASQRHQDPEEWVRRWRAEQGQERLQLWRAVGCPHCSGKGYRGRMGLHELMVADEAVRVLVRHRPSAAELQTAALAAGMVTLRQDGIQKALAGLTDLAEALAASNS